ncbi:flavin monoamine oxidase family protein [Pseudonocardia acaciae]|uniref:flavin monoamine oxidase family protein n=1 Tax=Pseudonocardia acaciae TaxID=551276 RepID=UPI000686020D|nr:NAD(P)/FAD-dependent oxidoreductase [Pseudonocardia acaciae]
MPGHGAVEMVEVAVVGAGLSGLVAARRLVQRGVRSVLVLEASDRVGGRVLNQRVDADTIVEAGGQFVGPGQDRVLALAGELGVPTFPTYDRGRTVLVLGGRRHAFRALPYRFPLAMADFLRAAVRLGTAARRVDPRRPWAAPDAAALDAATLADFVRRTTRTEPARNLFTLVSAVIFGGEPAEVSLLAALAHIRSTGGLYRLLAVRGGAQERRLAGGSHELALRMSAQLGDRVRLGRPVAGIERRDGGARLLMPGGGVVSARRVIVALAPADRARIGFDPPLPEPVATAYRRAGSLSAVRVNAVYDRPFWREAGLNGQALADTGPAPLTFDNSPPDAHVGILTTYLAGATGTAGNRLAPTQRQLDDPEARRDGVLDCLAGYFGERARRPVAYLEHDWRTERFLSGCLPRTPPGLLTSAGPSLREHPGPIVWAGSEQAEAWDGFMDGAIRSGERAANLVATQVSAGTGRG